MGEMAEQSAEGGGNVRGRSDQFGKVYPNPV
jgi:hypothetical protein